MIIETLSGMDDGIIEIVYDEHAVNPRTEYDNFGTMLCVHRRYDLGDSNHDIECIECVEKNKNVIFLPLYLYDHSGITIRTYPFPDIWDSGIIYVTKDKIRKEFGVKHITQKVRDIVHVILTAEVTIYDTYLQGDVTGYIIKAANGETIDSCFGFYGSDYKTNGMLDYIEGYLKTGE
jgi:hypothetical protein